MENGYTLPNGWIRTSIREIAEVNKRNPALRDFSDDILVTFVPMAAVDAIKGTIVSPQIRPLGDVRKGFTPFSNGDVIIAKITPSMENGKAAIAKDLQNGIGFGSTEFHVMSPKPEVLSSYLFHFVRQESFRWDARANFTGTAGQLRVPSRFIENYSFPLPPLPEQERIVERIESLFTQLDAGVAGLKRAKAALKRYKASVLKAACEGRLAPQDPHDEPAEEVLNRMGMSSLKSRNLPHLPESWCRATIEQIVSSEPGSIQSGPFGSDLLHSEFQKTGILAIGIDNVHEGRFSYGKEHRISAEKYSQVQKFTARPLDVLITVMATVGRCCVIPQSIELAIITKHVYRMSVNKTLVDPYYLMYNILGGDEVKAQLFSQVRGQTRPGINGAILRRILIPLAPLAEQRRIVVEIERRLSVVEELEKTIDANLKRAGRLRQAILKRAFEGRLG